MMVSEAKKRACDLLNEWHPDRGFHPVNDGQHPMVVGLTSLVQRIDYQRRVLVAMAGPGSVTAGEVRECLAEFALRDPEPDVLVETMRWAGVPQLAIDAVKHRLRGYEIRKIDNA